MQRRHSPYRAQRLDSLSLDRHAETAVLHALDCVLEQWRHLLQGLHEIGQMLAHILGNRAQAPALVDPLPQQRLRCFPQVEIRVELAADAFDSTLHEVQLDGSGSTKFVDSVGEPYALAVDAADRLFVADSDNDRILVVDLAATKPKARPFATAKGLDDPHCLAVAADGSVWTSDYDHTELFHFSATGALIESFTPRE